MAEAEDISEERLVLTPAQEKGVFALTHPSQKDVEGLVFWGSVARSPWSPPESCHKGLQGFILPRRRGSPLGSRIALSDSTSSSVGNVPKYPAQRDDH